MKYLKHFFLWILLLALSIQPGLSANADSAALPVSVEIQELSGAVNESTGQCDSYIRYPLLKTADAALAPAVEKINQAIKEKAHLSAYQQLLDSVQEGSTGLRMDCSLGIAARSGDGQPPFTEGKYLSILFSAEGKMLSGRPSQVYYPMTFDLTTGDEVTFGQLFADPESAKAFIEEYLENQVEPELSTHLENNQLFPVPYDRFFLDSFGHVILVYENSQLSFLSGTSGAVSFRYSQLSPWLDGSPEGVIAHIPWHLYGMGAAQTETRSADALWAWLESNACLIPAQTTFSLSADLQKSLARFHVTTDPGFYPGGVSYEVEEPVFRGALILTDEKEETVTGVQTSQLDLYGVSTGSTTLDEAAAFLGREPAVRMELGEAAAELYRVCPGEMLIYTLTRTADQQPMTLTLYADRQGVVQYVKLALQ